MAAWGNNYTIAGMPFVNISVSYGSLPKSITELVPFTDTNTHSNPNLDHSQYNCELGYFLAVQKSKKPSGKEAARVDIYTKKKE